MQCSGKAEERGEEGEKRGFNLMDKYLAGCCVVHGREVQSKNWELSVVVGEDGGVGAV